jgi:pyruvate/2-oxoglutarate/acetoin dehydrogenase E1 component
VRQMTFAAAIEDALAFAMSRDDRIIIMGEDTHMIRLNLFARFGKERIMAAPISESAFLGAAVGAALGGMRPVVEIMIVDFIGVALDALLNHAAKTEFFSGRYRWLYALPAAADMVMADNTNKVCGHYLHTFRD